MKAQLATDGESLKQAKQVIDLALDLARELRRELPEGQA